MCVSLPVVFNTHAHTHTRKHAHTYTCTGPVRFVDLMLMCGDPLRWKPASLRSRISGLVEGMKYHVHVRVKQETHVVLEEDRYVMKNQGFDGADVHFDIASLTNTTHMVHLWVYDPLENDDDKALLTYLSRFVQPQWIAPPMIPAQETKEVQQFCVGVKTLNRQDKVEEQIQSIRRYHANVDIVVLDKGLEDESEKYKHVHKVKYIYIGFDKGLSAGKNILVRNCAAPFIALMDDNVIWIGTDVSKAIQRLQVTDKSILTMSMEDNPYEGWFYKEEGALHLCLYSQDLKHKNRVPGLSMCHNTDIGLNVIVARRQFLLEHPWPEDFKMWEHTLYFLNLKHSAPNHVIACDDLEVKHHQLSSYQSYSKLRGRADSYLQQAFTAHIVHKTDDEQCRAFRLAERNYSVLIVNLHLIRGDPLKWQPAGLRSYIGGLREGMTYHVVVRVQRLSDIWLEEHTW